MRILYIILIISFTVNILSQHSYLDYDMYVFTIQWGATLCEDNLECKSKLKKIPKNIFTLHGLWPTYSDGRKIDECNKGDLIKVNITEDYLRKEMLTYWISYTSDNQHFWNHEYNKHGYCFSEKYNIDKPDKFFNTSINLYKNHSFDKLMHKVLDSDLTVSDDKELNFSYNELVGLFQKVLLDLKFDLNCTKYNGGTYLSEIRFYFDLEMKPINYKKESNCENETIIILLEK